MDTIPDTLQLAKTFPVSYGTGTSLAVLIRASPLPGESSPHSNTLFLIPF
jgi:hypothetical protein